MKIYKEWLSEDGKSIAYKTLTEWAEYFGLKMVEGSTWAWQTRSGEHINVEKNGGYGLLHDEFGKCADKLYFVGNADLGRGYMKLRPKQ